MCILVLMKEDGMHMLSDTERLKYEVARELGLLPKLKETGWAGLTAAESGKIGGLVGARKRKAMPGK